MNDLNFGGAGFYVWPAYALAVIVFAGLGWAAYRRLRYWSARAREDETDRS